MFLIIILSAQKELHSLGGSVWEHKELHFRDNEHSQMHVFLSCHACKFMTVATTVKRRLSSLIQGEAPVPALPLVLISMVTVPTMAAVPGAAQWDMDPDVESPVTCRRTSPTAVRCVCVWSQKLYR